MKTIDTEMVPLRMTFFVKHRMIATNVFMQVATNLKALFSLSISSEVTSIEC